MEHKPYFASWKIIFLTFFLLYYSNKQLYENKQINKNKIIAVFLLILHLPRYQFELNNYVESCNTQKKIFFIIGMEKMVKSNYFSFALTLLKVKYLEKYYYMVNQKITLTLLNVLCNVGNVRIYTFRTQKRIIFLFDFYLNITFK